MSRLPSLFVSHGAPLFATESGSSGPALQQWGAQLLKNSPVRGIVIMSPHWMARGPVVMTNPQPETWHDFGGFPAALYQLQYPAPGSVQIAQEVLALLAAAGIDAQPDAKRPLDHGAWVPLMHLFPKANVPVVQVALPVGYGPEQVFAMGQALQRLGDSAILLIGSGSMTHNLAEFAGAGVGPMPYVAEFSRWVEAAVVQGDRAALFNYRTLAPHATRAHPTEDHFLPLFFALGACDWGGQGAVAVHYLSREVMYGMLAMDAFALG